MTITSTKDRLKYQVWLTGLRYSGKTALFEAIKRKLLLNFSDSSDCGSVQQICIETENENFIFYDTIGFESHENFDKKFFESSSIDGFKIIVQLVDCSDPIPHLKLTQEYIKLGINPIIVFSFVDQVRISVDQSFEDKFEKYTGLKAVTVDPFSGSDIEKLLEIIAHHPFRTAKQIFLSEIPISIFPYPKFQFPILKKIDAACQASFSGTLILFSILCIVFGATFLVGNVPGNLIRSFFGIIQKFLITMFPQKLLIDLIVHGVLAGVGGVLAFLPNIIILFLGLTFLEGTGYFLRATKLMDSLMKRLDLDGRALIPLIIGLGCNAPAIMATRIVHQKWQRLRLIALIPFVTCSGRLPLLVLLISAFFPSSPTKHLLLVLAVNAIVVLVAAKISGVFVFKEKINSSVMRLPPIRIPSIKQLIIPIVENTHHFVRKAGTVILIGSILIWFLQTFPQPSNINELSLHLPANSDFRESSYLAKLGKLLYPIVEPLGFSWRETVAIIPGILAKENIVSTLLVIYSPNLQNLGISMRKNGITEASVISFMVFCMFYFPCLPTLGVIFRESGSIKFTIILVLFSLIIAWLAAFTIAKIYTIF